MTSTALQVPGPGPRPVALVLAGGAARGAYEVGVVRYLIERKGETVSREKLLEDVWGYESYPSTRTVDTHIAKLRAKIGDSGSEPRFILTIHGTGYKFVDPT